MGRRPGKVTDWSITISKEEDTTELPWQIEEFFKLDSVTKAYAVCEEADGEDARKHIHAGFKYYKPYKSDYTKWFTDTFNKECGFKDAELKFHYHDDLITLAGGYCRKAEHTVLFSKGISDEDLEYGKEQYERATRKKQLRKWGDRHHIITRNKFDCMVGGQMAIIGCDKQTAITELMADGWAFSESIPNTEKVYEQLFLDRQRHGATV